MNKPMPFEQIPAPWLPLDVKLAAVTDLVPRTMLQEHLRDTPFSDGRIDANPIMQGIAERAAFEFDENFDKPQAAEAFLQGSRYALALVRNAWFAGTTVLDFRLPLQEGDDYYTELMELVNIYGAYSKVAPKLVNSCLPYIDPENQQKTLVGLGMYTLFYLANAGEISKDKQRQSLANHWKREAVLAKLERNLLDEANDWTLTDRQILEEMEWQFEEPAA